MTGVPQANATGPSLRTGGEILIDQLVIQGVDIIFGVPGESYLSALDALHDRPGIRFITCRQEAGAASMSEAYGKLTGRPGVCFVTRGPGATQASIGVHIAFQDSTPMILLVGQVARGMIDREAFQEIDYSRMFAPVAKQVLNVDDAARLPELVARAFAVAVSGRPGPVVLVLPEDMLSDRVVVGDAKPFRVASPKACPSEMDRCWSLLSQAERPLVLVGGGAWSEAGIEDLRAFAAANGLPIAVTFRRQDLIDNSDPHYVGHVGLGIDPHLAERIRSADLILAIGPRLGEATTGGYQLLRPPVLDKIFVHVYPDPEELGRVYQTDLSIVSDGCGFVAAAKYQKPLDGSRWADWLRSARADYEAFSKPIPCTDQLDLAAVIDTLRRALPDDAIVTNGAGNFTGWIHRFFQYRRFRTQLAPTNGAMGYGVPAAIAAAAVYPGRRSVAIAGDGDFMMTVQELATAAHYRLPVMVLVVNNGMFGTIRMHQEREYPGRAFATDLTNPNFVDLARSFGMKAWSVEQTGAVETALHEALAVEGPTLVELVTNPATISPGRTIAKVRPSNLATA